MKVLIGLLVSSPAYSQVLIEPLNPLPEPGTIALIAAAAGVMLFRYYRRKWRR